MNSERSTLRHDHRGEQEHAVTQSSQAVGLEFSTVEDLLRHDNEQHPVPTEVAERVSTSINDEPKPKKPWYRNLFGS